MQLIMVLWFSWHRGSTHLSTLWATVNLYNPVPANKSAHYTLGCSHFHTVPPFWNALYPPPIAPSIPTWPFFKF